MGCDIHQINIIIDENENLVQIDGEIPCGVDTQYKSDLVSELVPYRSYDIFGILAGVRGDAFQIQDNVCCGIPNEIQGELRQSLEDTDYHSFTWFYMESLLKELAWTKKKIKMFCKASAISDPGFISSGQIDEYRWLARNVDEIMKKLQDAKQKIERENPGWVGDFKKCKVLFFFDS